MDWNSEAGTLLISIAAGFISGVWWVHAKEEWKRAGRVIDEFRDPEQWQRDEVTPAIEHRGGVWWHDAPIPPKRHQCTAQTRGSSAGAYVERCACGAVGDGRGLWVEKNSRTSQ